MRDFFTPKSFFVVCAAILAFLIPSNLFLKWNIPSAYVHGILVDYLLPKLYLSDLPILGLLLGWLIEAVRSRKALCKRKCMLMATWLGFVTLQALSNHSLSTFWFGIKIIEFGLLAAFLLRHQKILRHPLVLGALALGLCFQSTVGLIQYATQTSVFHSYYAFGEPNLDRPIGLAKNKVGTIEKILPYGTTAHPNILAGYLVIGLIILLSSIKKKQLILALPAVLLGGVTLLCAESLSAIAVLATWAIWRVLLKHKPRATLLLTIALTICVPISVHLLAQAYPQNTSLMRRDLLNRAAILMFEHHPITGVGVNAFTTQLENTLPNTEVVRFIQPAHNLPLLWLAEAGVIGVGFCVAALTLFGKRHWRTLIAATFILLPIWTLDHYLYTQQTGLILVVLFFVYIVTAWGAARDLE